MSVRPDDIAESDWEAMPVPMRVMFAELRKTAERAGVVVPVMDGEGQVRLPPPSISLHGRPSVTTRKVAEIAAAAGLYLMNKDLVLINPNTGEREVMTAKVFREWIDNHVVVYKKKAGEGDEVRPVGCWMPHDMADSMLASPDFRARIPRVVRVNMVRLPVWRKPVKKGDMPRIELLGEGYDAESMTYTVKGLDYPDDMSSVDALAWIRELLQHFDWALTDKESEKGVHGTCGRSFAVMMCAALTCYCETMFPPGTKKPMFFFNANEPGSGKTLLAQACLYPVHGFIGFVRWREHEEELIKTLDANARWMRPALFLDDFSGHLKSELLNQWLTEPMHEGRIIGTGDWFNVPRVGVTMMTGNGVTLQQDIQRRSLMVDLFMTTSARDKTYPEDAIHLSDSWFLKEENRRRWLGAMWALVRDFGLAAKPKGWRPLETFEDWSEVIVPMVRAMELPDPLQPYTPPDAGDTAGDDMMRLIKVVIEEKCIKAGVDMCSIKLTDMVPLARKHGLYVHPLLTVEAVMRMMDAKGGQAYKRVPWEDGDGREMRDPTDAEKRDQALAWLPPDNKMATSFGMLFGKRATGKQLAVGGKRWEFGKRGSAKTSTYEVRALK